MLYSDAGSWNDKAMASCTGKKGRAGETGLVVGKAVLLVGCGIDGLVDAAAVVSHAGHGG